MRAGLDSATLHSVRLCAIQYTCASLPNSFLFKSIAHDTGAKFAISARSSCAELNSIIRARSDRVKKAESHEKNALGNKKHGNLHKSGGLTCLLTRKQKHSFRFLTWKLILSQIVYSVQNKGENNLD